MVKNLNIIFYYLPGQCAQFRGNRSSVATQRASPTSSTESNKFLSISQQTCKSSYQICITSKIKLPLSLMTLIRHWNTQGRITLNPTLLNYIGMSLNSLATVPLYNWN